MVLFRFDVFVDMPPMSWPQRVCRYAEGLVRCRRCEALASVPWPRCLPSAPQSHSSPGQNQQKHITNNSNNKDNKENDIKMTKNKQITTNQNMIKDNIGSSCKAWPCKAPTWMLPLLVTRYAAAFRSSTQYFPDSLD